MIVFVYAAMTAIAGGQSLSAPITLELRATPMEKACEAISKQSGLVLHVSAPLKNEVVAVRVHGLRADVLLKQLGKATQSESELRKDGFWFVRSVQKQKELEQREFEIRRDRAGKTVQRIKELVAKGPKPVEAAEVFRKSIEKLSKDIENSAETGKGLSLDGPRLASPASALTRRLAALLDPDTIAGIADGESLVFAADPTPAQIRLPKTATKALEEFEEAQSRIAAIADEPWGKEASKSGLYEDVIKGAQLNGGLGKVLFTVSNWSGRFAFSTDVFRADGSRALWGFDRTGLDSERYLSGGASGTREMASLSADTLKFLEIARPDPRVAANATDAPSIVPTITARLVELILHPEVVDPLSLLVTDAVFSLSKGNIVACIPDSAYIHAMASLRGKKLDVKLFMQSSALEILSDSGLAIVKSPTPVIDSICRVDRKALSRFLNEKNSIGRTTVESLARCHFEGGATRPWSFFDTYDTALNDIGKAGLEQQGALDSRFLKWVGSFSQSQWKTLRSGVALDVAGLPPNQRQLSEKALRSAWTERDPSFEPPVTDLNLAVSECCSKGIVPGSYLRLKSSEEDSVRMNLSGLSQHSVSLNAKELAAKISGAGLKMIDQYRFSFGKRKRSEFTWSIAPGVIVVVDADEPIGNPTRQPTLYSALPEGFRKKVDEYVRDAKRPPSNR